MAEVWERIWHWIFPRDRFLILLCHLPLPKGAQGEGGHASALTVLITTGSGTAMDLDTEIWAVRTDCYLDFGPSKPDGTMKFHQAMFLSCKQALKNISLRWGGLHHTFPTRPSRALQNVSTNSQGFIQPGEEKCENSLDNFYFALNSLILVIFFSWKSEVTWHFWLYVNVQSEFWDLFGKIWSSCLPFLNSRGASSSPQAQPMVPPHFQGGVPLSSPFTDWPPSFIYCTSYWFPQYTPSLTYT